MQRLKSYIALSALLVTLATIGCHGHSMAEKYFLVANNLKLPYWQTVDAGFEKAAAEYGVKPMLSGPDTLDPQAELTAFQQAVAQKPAGILVSVADAAMFRDDINSAIAAGIPVITVDSDAPTSNRLFFIGTNNIEAGRLGGKLLVQKLGDKGNIVFFSYPEQPNLAERLEGYKDEISSHPGLKIVDVIDIKGDANNAFDSTQAYLAKTGPDKIDAFVCLESDSGKAVAEVLKRAHATDRVLIAMDTDSETLNDIQDGSIAATVSQKPYTMGYVGLKSLAEVHQYPHTPFKANYTIDSFSPYPVFIDTGTALVDKSNVSVYLDSAKAAGVH
ncbi:MAG: substrate-binding domain-containing protein [Acidobacteriaceae bacterium]